MKYIAKKYWLIAIIAIVINLPIVLICTIRTNYSLILKGDTVIFDSVVEIDTDYEQKGSFSTIYVLSLEKSTIFQNILADIDPTVEKNKISKSESHLSYSENLLSSKIMYESSVSKSIVLAYKEASKINTDIKIDYKLGCYKVTYYSVDSRFRIGDEIIKISGYRDNIYYEVEAEDEAMFRNMLGSLVEGDKVLYRRNNQEYTIELERTDSFGCYDIYDINYDTIFPSLKINETNVGGPSGGLLQTLSIYNRLIEEDITHGYKIAGTGTISHNGSVGAIGGIREKIPTALDDSIDIFFCVSANYSSALEAYNSLPNRNKMKLVEISTFYDAINYLKELN
ncbi:MAG: S16 family serine protease [Anaeroplasma sp.]